MTSSFLSRSLRWAACGALAATPGLAQSLDPSFGTNGVVTMPLGTNAVAQRVLSMPDGRLVFVGSVTTGSGTDVLLVRTFSTGSPDHSFGSNGVVQADLSGTDLVNAAALQSDGAIVVASASSGAPGFTVARYLATGAPDPSFSGDGWTTVPIGVVYDDPADVLVQPDGAILVLGTTAQDVDLTSTDWALVRMLPDGSPDLSFGTNGLVTLNPGTVDLAFRMALQSDGKIVVVGNAPTGPTTAPLTMARLEANGALDTGFGTGGYVQTPITIDAYTIGHALAVAVAGDGSLLVGGAVRTVAGDPALAVYHFDATGVQDATFNGGAGAFVATLDARECPGATCEQLNGIDVQADGKIVAAGFVAYTETDVDHVVLRLNADGTPDLTFSATGVVTRDGSGGVLSDVVLPPNNQVVVAGQEGDALSVARYTTGQPLPVELVAFTATLDANRAHLAWTTASETDNAGFTVETRRGDEGPWTALGFVAGHGTTVERHDYAHVTEPLAPGRHAFRLRQTDVDGVVTHSPTVEVAIGVTELRLARRAGGTYLWVPEEQTADLYDAAGRRIRHGLTTGLVPHADLASGIYFVRSNGKTLSFAVVR